MELFTTMPTRLVSPIKAVKEKVFPGNQKRPDHSGDGKGNGQKNNQRLLEGSELQDQHGKDGNQGNQYRIGHSSK